MTMFLLSKTAALTSTSRVEGESSVPVQYSIPLVQSTVYAEWLETRDLTRKNFDSCLRIKVVVL